MVRDDKKNTTADFHLTSRGWTFPVPCIVNHEASTTHISMDDRQGTSPKHKKGTRCDAHTPASSIVIFRVPEIAPSALLLPILIYDHLLEKSQVT